MNRMLTSTGLALVLLSTAVGPSAVAAPPPGAITWTVDHAKKTITVQVQLEIYTGCSGNPMGTAKERPSACGLPQSMVAGPTQFLADKIKAQMEQVWNKPYRYRCYTLIVSVDIKRGTDRSHVAPGRIGIRIDPSPAGIRDYVNVSTNDTSRWRSNDPADRLAPHNDGEWETTWGEASALDAIHTYAHELGHILGLHDGYEEVVDQETGVVRSVPYPDAALDLMSFGTSNISQETIDRLVKRNLPLMKETSGQAVTDADLACDYQGRWAGHRLAGSIKYCGSVETPYWGADIVHTSGDRAFVAYDIPEGSDQPVPAEIITSFVNPEFNESVKGTGTFVPAEPPAPPHFVIDNGEGTWIITLEVGRFCQASQ